MKKITLLNVIAVVAVSLLAGCGSSKTLTTSEWVSEPVAIDANMNDWKLPLSHYNSSVKVNYSLKNNEDFLYLCLMTSDPQMITRITMAGLEIAIDTVGKKKKHITIMLHPVVSRPQQAPVDPSGKGDRPLPEISGSTMTISGIGNPAVPGDHYGIQAQVGYTYEKNLAYEIAIPLKSFLKSSFSHPLGITLTLKGLSMSDPGSGGGARPEPPAGGMSRPPSGMGPGGGTMGPPPGGGNNPMSELSTDKKVSFTIQLASSK